MQCSFKADRLGLGKIAAIVTVAALGLSATAGGANAATCPSDGLSPDVTRIMDVDGPGSADDAQCYAYGTGNPTQTSGTDAIRQGSNTTQATFTLDANFTQPFSPSAIKLIEDVDAGKTGSVLSFTGGNTNGPGDFTIDNAVTGYANLIVALKMGGGGAAAPDWFAWVIPNVAGTYDWAWAEGKETGLSGIGLYGVTAVIPLPTPALLLLTAFGGLALFGRRRKAVAA